MTAFLCVCVFFFLNRRQGLAFRHENRDFRVIAFKMHIDFLSFFFVCCCCGRALFSCRLTMTCFCLCTQQRGRRELEHLTRKKKPKMKPLTWKPYFSTLSMEISCSARLSSAYSTLFFPTIRTSLLIITSLVSIPFRSSPDGIYALAKPHNYTFNILLLTRCL